MVADGINGWSLVEYNWDEKTGIGTYTYERVEPTTGKLEVHVRRLCQPYNRHHQGWFMISKYV